MTGISPDLCVLSDPYLTQYQIESLEHAVENTETEIPLVVVNDPDAMDYNPDCEAAARNSTINLSTLRLFFEVLQRERWWTFVIAEKKMSELFGQVTRDRHYAISEIDVLKNAEVLEVTPKFDGNWIRFPTDVISKVREFSDIAIRYGFGLIEGEILNAPQHGVLSFHPADIRNYRGLGPPQVFLDKRDQIGLTLQRLNEEIDGGEIIDVDHIDISDCNTLWQIYDAIHELQISMLTEGIKIAIGSTESPINIDSLGSYHSTKRRRKLSFALRVLYMNISGHARNNIYS